MQAPPRLRLPRADGVLPAGRARGVDDRADGDREQGDARRLRGRPGPHPRRGAGISAAGAAHAGNQSPRRGACGAPADPAVEARMNTVRLLPFAAADGPRNMAADEVLLEAAVGGGASLRFYGWSEPTLSLGYFQPQSVRLSDPRLAGLPWVRRPT